MKILIDISNKDYEKLKDGHIPFSILDVIQNGTPIPDNDCNNCEKAWTDKCERAECYKNNYKHWTPYKESYENKKNNK